MSGTYVGSESNSTVNDESVSFHNVALTVGNRLQNTLHQAKDIASFWQNRKYYICFNLYAPPLSTSPPPLPNLPHPLPFTYFPPPPPPSSSPYPSTHLTPVPTHTPSSFFVKHNKHVVCCAHEVRLCFTQTLTLTPSPSFFCKF